MRVTWGSSSASSRKLGSCIFFSVSQAFSNNRPENYLCVVISTSAFHCRVAIYCICRTDKSSGEEQHFSSGLSLSVFLSLSPSPLSFWTRVKENHTIIIIDHYQRQTPSRKIAGCLEQPEAETLPVRTRTCNSHSRSSRQPSLSAHTCCVEQLSGSGTVKSIANTVQLRMIEFWFYMRFTQRPNFFEIGAVAAPL